MQTYVIVEEAPGRFRVRQGRRLLPDDFDSQEAALRHVKVLQAPGDKVLSEDEDGYRKSLIRKHWRR